MSGSAKKNDMAEKKYVICDSEGSRRSLFQSIYTLVMTFYILFTEILKNIISRTMTPFSFLYACFFYSKFIRDVRIKSSTNFFLFLFLKNRLASAKTNEISIAS